VFVASEFSKILVSDKAHLWVIEAATGLMHTKDCHGIDIRAFMD